MLVASSVSVHFKEGKTFFANSFANSSHSLSLSLAPQVFGVIKKNTGSYAIALALMAASLACSAILVLIIRRITKRTTGFQQLDNSELHVLEDMDSAEN